MKVIKEVYRFNDFDFWSGAEDTAQTLEDNGDFETVMDMLDDEYPDGMTETELNDLFWFENDFIAELLGYDSWEEYENHDEDADDEDEDED